MLDFFINYYMTGDTEEHYVIVMICFLIIMLLKKPNDNEVSNLTWTNIHVELNKT